MKINIQSKSPWLENVPLQNTSCDVVVRLISEDGVSLFLPASFLAASSEYLCFLLTPNSTNCCSNTDTVIHLPSVSGLSLKLFSQILIEGESEQLSGDDIKSCLKNVEAVLEQLGCKVKLVTKLGSKKAPGKIIRVVSTESLAQDYLVKDEYKEVEEIYKNEYLEDFDSQLEVNGGIKVENIEIGSVESFVNLRPSALQEEVCSNSDSCDINQNMLLKECEPNPEHAHTVLEDIPSPSRWSNPQKVKSQKQGSRIDDKDWFNNARREFQCLLCDLGFFTSAGLQRHTSDKHGDNYQNKEFKCLVCDISYFTENSLNKHKYEKHRNGPRKDQTNTSESTSNKTCDNFEGSFSCTANLCDYACTNLGRIVKHWNQNHTELASEASFLNTATSTTVTLYQAFAFILQCRLCGIVRCSRYKMNKAVWTMTLHLNSHHPDQTGTDNVSDLYSVLQERLEITEPGSDDRNIPSLKQIHVSNKAVVKVPTVAEFTYKQSFIKKGYSGPYHCLGEGCSFVCDKFGLTTQKLLVKHWSQEHGNVKPLIYLDMSSFTIINVKIICNNVGYCSYVGCDHLMFASRTSDFRTSVLNHWKNIHSSPCNSFTSNMCKTISDKHVPDITEEEAVAIAKRTNISRKSDEGSSMSSDIICEEEYLRMRRRMVDTSLKKVSEQDGSTSLKCDLCGKKWMGNVSKDRLIAVRHMGLHLQVRVRCSLCGVSLKNVESFRNHKSQVCKKKSKSRGAFVEKKGKDKNDKVLVKGDPSKDKKRRAVNCVGKLDILSSKRVVESLGALMNDDKVKKFGKVKEVCSNDNITTEKKQTIEGSKNDTDDTLYEDVVVEDVSPDVLSDKNLDDSYMIKHFKCPLKCSTTFTMKSDILIHLKNFHRFNHQTLKKIIKLNPQL